MHRRGFLPAVAICVLLSSTTAALADRADDMVEWLAGQGYTQIELSRTLLGRARVLAWRDGGRRELIINPRTGEILRDVWFEPDGGVRAFSDRGGDGGAADDGGPGGGDGSQDGGNSGDGGDDGGDGGDDGGDSSDDDSGDDSGDDDSSDDSSDDDDS